MKNKIWVEISRKALEHNFQVFKKVVGRRVKVMVVVKANAYGHGLREVVGVLEELGAEWLGVDNVDEGLVLRRMGIKRPVLVLGYTMLERLREAIDNEISLTVYNQQTIRRIMELNLAKKARVHLKVETGTNRQGQREDGVLKLASLMSEKGRAFLLEGVSTHFANVEDTLDPMFAMAQLERFTSVVKALEKRGMKVPLPHAAATAAVLLYPEVHFKMVRVGVGLYGLWPSREVRVAFAGEGVELVPVLSWRSLVAQVKVVEARETVGYGRTWQAPRRTRIAVVPVGYADGYDRKLSNSGRVLIRGESASVIGRVAMNMIVVDISGMAGVKVEDEVVLIGRSGRREVSCEEIAEKVGTINYEVVARINPNLPRIVV